MNDEHERHHEDLPAYALGALGQLEATAVERHVMRCTACARELERLRTVVDTLPVAVAQHRASPELKQAVMAGMRPAPVVRERRRLFVRRPALALAGVLACAALVLGGYGLGTSGDDPRVLAASVDRTQLPDARASLTAQGDVAVLRATGLPALDPGQVYVVWVDRGEGPVYASSFNVQPGGDGQAGVAGVEGVERVMVTREASTAVTRPSESPVLTVRISS